MNVLFINRRIDADRYGYQAEGDVRRFQFPSHGLPRTVEFVGPPDDRVLSSSARLDLGFARQNNSPVQRRM